MHRPLFALIALAALVVASAPPPVPAAGEGPIGLTPLPPLEIVGNDGWVEAAALHEFPGTGTAEDPYVIANRELVLTEQFGLRILHSDVHFVIRDSLFHAPAVPYTIGIQLYRAENGVVRENEFRGAHTAILVNNKVSALVEGNDITGEGTQNGSSSTGISVYGDHATVRNNVVDAAWMGIRLYGRHFHVDGNTITNVTMRGLNIQHSWHSTISNNTVVGTNLEHPSAAGFWMYTGVFWNVFENNSVTGFVTPMDFTAGHYNVIRGNTIHGGSAGFLFQTQDPDSDFPRRPFLNELYDNHVIGARVGVELHYADSTRMNGNVLEGTDIGILSVEGSRNNLDGTIVASPTLVGVRLDGGRDTTVSDSVITDAPLGVHVAGTTRAIVSNNDVSATAHGVHYEDATAGSVRGNSIRDADVGVRVTSGAGVNVTGNTIPGARIGVHLEYSPSSHAHANTLTDTDAAILVEGSPHARVTENVVLSGGEVALRLAAADAATVSHNDVQHSGTALLLEDVLDAVVHANRLVGNDEGLRLTRTQRATVHANVMHGNLLGISVATSSGNLVFDNDFRNPRNHDVDWTTVRGDENTWSVPVRAGTNVLGGPCVGGNHWNDYSGTDVDHDGLGETSYGPVEHDSAAWVVLSLQVEKGVGDPSPLVPGVFQHRSVSPGRATFNDFTCGGALA